MILSLMKQGFVLLPILLLDTQTWIHFAAPASITILHSKYITVNVNDVVQAETNLNEEQQEELASVLANFKNYSMSN